MVQRYKKGVQKQGTGLNYLFSLTYFEYSPFCCQYKPKVKSEFAAYKVGVSRKQSLSLVYGKSEARKWPKKGSLWLPEVLVNNVYFCRKKRAALQLCKMREAGIFL